MKIFFPDLQLKNNIYNKYCKKRIFKYNENIFFRFIIKK